MSSGPVDSDAPFHRLALLAWLVTATLPSLLTSNPVYLGLGLIFVGWTHRQVASRSPTAHAWGSFARFALFFVVFTLLFNLLLGGGGSTVLLELPAFQVHNDDGAVVFQIGGDVTLESLVFALIRALALLLVIFALATFNALVDHYQLLRGLPRQLDQAATVMSIAVAFMPQLVAAQKDIREALALRGHRLRSLRDFVPLILVLLSEALERAMALAESMEARGYGGVSAADQDGKPPSTGRFIRWAIAAGLLAVAVGLVAGDLDLRLFPEGSWADAYSDHLLVVGGALLIVSALAGVGAGRKRTRYRRELWRPRDSALTLLSSLAGVGLVVLFFYDREPFFYPVFPIIQRPEADPRILVLLLALLAPSLCRPEAQAPETGSET